MITSWSLWLLTVTIGTLLIASTTTADANTLTTTDVPLSDGPVISPSDKDIILQPGQNFTLKCRGNRPVFFKQQHIPEDVTGLFNATPTNTSINDFEYEAEIKLYNVDRFAVGYYACYDDTVDENDVLNNIVEEPNNTAHISYIYIYVNDLNTMLAPMRAFVITMSNSKFVIECRPTTPDIKVKLTWSQSNKIPDSVKFSPKIGFIFSKAPKRSEYKCEGRRGNELSSMHIRNNIIQPPAPKISSGPRYFLEGETFSVNCTVEPPKNSPVVLSWTIPGSFSKVVNNSNEYNARSGPLFNNYTIRKASKEENGTYVCTSKNSFASRSATFIKTYLREPLLKMEKAEVQKANPLIISGQKAINIKVEIDEYPKTNITVFRDDVPMVTNFIIRRNEIDCRATCMITVRNLTVEQSANYTVQAANQYIKKNVTFDLRVPGPPKVDFGPQTDKRYLLNTKATLICDAIGYPLPQIDWMFVTETGEEKIWDKAYQNDEGSLFKITSRLEIPVRVSGDIICQASNHYGKDLYGIDNSSRRFLVYDTPGGFGIKNRDRTWFSQNEDVVLTCLASKYDFVNVTWYREDYFEELPNVEFTNNSFSLVAKLKLDHITLEQAGDYICIALTYNGTEENETISIEVEGIRPPEILDPDEDTNAEVLIYHSINFTCQADAVPPPQMLWYKDGKQIENMSYIYITTYDINHSTRYSILNITQMHEEDVGKYECKVTSRGAIQSKYFDLTLKEKPSHKATYLSVAGLIFFVLILLVVYLTWKVKKEKQFRKELAAAGLLNFKEGATKSINPELGIDEQADLLPYDEKFEFPVEKLILGKQLGAGAFGVVYKADARGIINAEETTTVAVKMVKKTADNMYIKALASELKIMVHLGKHINIVNLLGACTKNVGKRELIVIVEYCKYGNIHNYMQKHREVFIDQLNDNPEKSLGKINRGYSCSSGNSGMHSEYFGSNHTQDTDHTFVNTANTNRSGRKDNTKQQVEFVKVSETGYVQPQWRSNYESDYSFDGRTPRPLCSRDLLAWAFQIARGMEYLASRKVLHGDLAARNILLADDNIVKICDFGLARSIYKNDEYKKKENSPLPVKWLAIECMLDQIFSTQSDVWSFGIVLWELFSLAKTPYPNISPQCLSKYLSEGNRLEKPQYADDKLYDVMMRCWEKKPSARPTFSQLQQILGSFLEDNVRNHYVDLNATYMDMNIKREGEDYLAMVSAPDYNNVVTPSPHQYVNGPSSFFPPTPTQLQHDEEGYLQMSPAARQNKFNARAQGTEFDFNPRKFAPKVSEASSYGSELTPMLTLNNLPRSGSESDHEGNVSPFHNVCPRIEEEADEVFETKQNNAKNVQPNAHTNPTYITFSADDEKKNQNFTNNYININVPNGLVK